MTPCVFDTEIITTLSQQKITAEIFIVIRPLFVPRYCPGVRQACDEATRWESLIIIVARKVPQLCVVGGTCEWFLQNTKGDFINVTWMHPWDCFFFPVSLGSLRVFVLNVWIRRTWVFEGSSRELQEQPRGLCSAGCRGLNCVCIWGAAWYQQHKGF